MGLRAKFNIAILVTFLVGFCSTGLLLNSMFEKDARETVLQSARIMMTSANAVRHYTSKEITPVLGFERDGKFLSASVPAYAARLHFNDIQGEFPEYAYKEATLNPTNLANRTTDWEADIVNRFRRPSGTIGGGALREVISERDTPTGKWLNLARPIHVPDASCLRCHGQPSQAPATMTAFYGTKNGFGWHVSEVIGAQIVSLPLAVPLSKARRTLLFFLVLLTSVFIVMTVILNGLLHYLIIRPVKTISNIATEVSLGREAEEIKPFGNDEISALGRAFNRMRRSLNQAMQMLDDPEPSARANA
jgi:HAMP domain-containing protein